MAHTNTCCTVHTYKFARLFTFKK